MHRCTLTLAVFRAAGVRLITEADTLAAPLASLLDDRRSSMAGAEAPGLARRLGLA